MSIALARKKWKIVPFLTERSKAYCSGGLHPVTLGDVFKDGQYKVIRKLGYGASATVWLARDVMNERYVAMKIITSKYAEPVHEVQVLRYINEKTSPDQASKHITRLIDVFDHEGPNGVHKCLVFEPMGATVNTMVEELPQFHPRTRHMKVRYPPWMAKSILKQCLQALALLHSIGIAHGDVQPGNMLFSMGASLDTIPETELRQLEDAEAESITPPIRTGDEDIDRSLPLYLCASQPLAKFVNIRQGFRIKLSDMGGSYFMQQPPATIETPTGLRAPEFVVRGQVNNTLDLWSFGCLVFELITGQRLFNVMWQDSETLLNDEHILMFTEVLGELPDSLYQHWHNSALYFTPDRKLFNPFVGRAPGDKRLPPLPVQTMEDRFDKAAPDMDTEEALQVKALIRRILQYDPAMRPSAAALLDDTWFQQIDAGVID